MSIKAIVKICELIIDFHVVWQFNFVASIYKEASDTPWK